MRKVQQSLVISIGVDRRHQTALDCEIVMQNLGDRSQAVGCARSIRDYVMLFGVVRLVVDSEDNRNIFILCRGRYDDLLTVS